MNTQYYVSAIFALLLLGCSSPDYDLVITNAHVITADGTVLKQGSVAIKGNRIQYVGEEEPDIATAEFINAEGRTVLPGLIDTHVHLSVTNISDMPESKAEFDSLLKAQLPELLNSYLGAGITSVMSTGDFWPRFGHFLKQVESGMLEGPRILSSGPVFTAKGGHPAVGPICGPPEGGQANPWCREHLAAEVTDTIEVENKVEFLAETGVDFIKMVYDSLAPPNVNQLNSTLAIELLESAQEHGLPAYAHVYSIPNAIELINHGLNGLVHLPNTPNALYGHSELIEALANKEITFSTTLVASEEVVNFTGEEYNINQFERQKQTLSKVIEAVPELVALGTDTPWLTPFNAYHREIELVTEAGMTPKQVIQSATKNAAVHIGMADKIGTIEKGKIADLLIVEGNPLQDISALRNVVTVIKGGNVVINISAAK